MMEAGVVSEIAIAWLAEMEDCVRSLDYVRCRAIFAPDVVGFGTKATLVVGLEALEREQWRQIWGTIRGFTFNREHLHCRIYGDQGIWLACPWMSEWQPSGGVWLKRPGRITAVLERRGTEWLAVHTHHSLAPRPDAGQVAEKSS